MHIADGAVFNGVEGSINLDVLTGGATRAFNTGWNDARYAGVTLGWENGSGTFAGTISDTDASQNHNGIIRKIGTGTQTFSGYTTYHGDTIVEEGTLEFLGDPSPLNSSSISFYPQAYTVSNQARGEGAGTGTLILDGFLDIDTTLMDMTEGNYWVLIDKSNLAVTYGANFEVADLVTATSYTANSGVWSFSSGGITLNFEEATGALFVGDPFPIITDPISVTAIGFNGAALEVGFDNLITGRTYDLTRSADLEDGFPTVVETQTVTGSAATFTDATPPAGKAFYQLTEQ